MDIFYLRQLFQWRNGRKTRTVYKSFYAIFALTPLANLRFFFPLIFGLTPFAMLLFIISLSHEYFLFTSTFPVTQLGRETRTVYKSFYAIFAVTPLANLRFFFLFCALSFSV